MGSGLIALIKSLGYTGIWGIVIAESGILFCFFLPGDSLLFATGFLASQHYLDIWILSIGCFIAAFLGNILGYEIGRRLGMKMFKKGDRRFIKLKHIEMGQAFFTRHGGMAIVLARFLPVIRTIAPFMAGMARMPYQRFAIYSAVGAALWGGGLPWLGYFLGRRIPAEDIDHYLIPVIGLIILAVLIPSYRHLRRERKAAEPETLDKSSPLQ